MDISRYASTPGTPPGRAPDVRLLVGLRGWAGLRCRCPARCAVVVARLAGQIGREAHTACSDQYGETSVKATSMQSAPSIPRSRACRRPLRCDVGSISLTVGGAVASGGSIRVEQTVMSDLVDSEDIVCAGRPRTTARYDYAMPECCNTA